MRASWSKTIQSVLACGPRVLFLPTKQSARPIYSHDNATWKSSIIMTFTALAAPTLPRKQKMAPACASPFWFFQTLFGAWCTAGHCTGSCKKASAPACFVVCWRFHWSTSVCHKLIVITKRSWSLILLRPAESCRWSPTPTWRKDVRRTAILQRRQGIAHLSSRRWKVRHSSFCRQGPIPTTCVHIILLYEVYRRRLAALQWFCRIIGAVCLQRTIRVVTKES